jgi:hypothetical protein
MNIPKAVRCDCPDVDIQKLTQKDMSQRKHCLIANGQTYFGKSTRCPKRNGEDNPTWLINELVYTEFAHAAELRMPAVALFECENAIFFASEIKSDRHSLKIAHKSIEEMVATSDNKVQLTRALLLDLALLNSDRTASQILCDSKDVLWFIDHDKTLWGDGRPQDSHPKPGDLGRLNVTTLNTKFDDYMGDYLHCPNANRLVFSPHNYKDLIEQLESLSLDRRHCLATLKSARQRIPPPWMTAFNDQFEMTERFLPEWWQELTGFLRKDASFTTLVEILRKRGHL